MKKILALIGSLTLITTSSTALISCGEPKVSDENKTSLESLSLITDLGVINEVDLITDDQQDNWVYNAITAKNSDFSKISNEVNILFDDGDFSNPPVIKFKVQAKKTSNKYKGELEFQVTYNFDNEYKRWLQNFSVVKKKDIEVTITKNRPIATIGDMKNAFNSANGIDPSTLDFKQFDIKTNANGRQLTSKLKVSGGKNNSFYAGTVIINVTHKYMSTGPDDKY